MVCVLSAVEGKQVSKLTVWVSSAMSQRNLEFELRGLRYKKLVTLLKEKNKGRGNSAYRERGKAFSGIYRQFNITESNIGDHR